MAMPKYPVRVLLVDDNEREYLLIRSMLLAGDAEAFDLQWASCYHDGLNAIHAGSYDLYLLASRLGSHTAGDLLDAAKHARCSAPLIVLTREHDHAADVDVIRIGAADYLIVDQLDAVVLHRSIHYALEHSQMQQALRASEDRFRSAFEDAAIGMALVSLEGRWTRVNRSLCAMLGYAEAELLALTFQQITHPDDLDADLDLVQQLLAGALPTYQLEKRYLHKNGHHVWALLNVSLVRDPAGRPLYFVSQMQDITERKRAEQSLRESEATNRALLNAIPDLMFRISGTGAYLDCKVKRDADLPVAASDLVGMRVADLLPTEVAQQALAAIESALHGGQVQMFEYDLDRTGGLHTYEARISVCGSDEVLMIVRDITQRKQAEAALKQERDFAQQVLNTMGQGLTIADADGVFQYVNPAYGRMLGYAPEDLVCQRPHDLVIPEDWAHLINFAELPETFGPHVFEARHRHRDGKIVYCLVTRVPRWHNGTYTGTIAVVSNLTERKRAEERLSHLAAIVESSHDAIVGTSLDGTITSWNSGAEALYGYTAQEAIGKSKTLIIPADRANEVDQTLARLRAGMHVDDYDSVRVRKNGSPVTVSLAHSPIRDLSGSMIGVSTIARDITARKKVEQMKDEFVATASHELRTPLTSIKGYVDLIRNGDAGPISPLIDEFLEIVQGSAERLVDITNGMLETARLEAGDVRLSRGPVALKDVVDPVVRALEPLVAEKGQRLTLDLPDDLPAVHGDRGRIAEIITNLLGNAHKYTPSGGSIHLAAQRLDEIEAEHSGVQAGSSLLVQVRDTGIGIAPDDQAHLFTRFFRTSNPAIQGIGGTGLGLYMTRALVELHGGRIWVESTPQHGTTVSFTLPTADPGNALRGERDRRPEVVPRPADVVVVAEQRRVVL